MQGTADAPSDKQTDEMMASLFKSMGGMMGGMGGPIRETRADEGGVRRDEGRRSHALDTRDREASLVQCAPAVDDVRWWEVGTAWWLHRPCRWRRSLVHSERRCARRAAFARRRRGRCRATCAGASAAHRGFSSSRHRRPALRSPPGTSASSTRCCPFRARSAFLTLLPQLDYCYCVRVA